MHFGPSATSAPTIIANIVCPQCAADLEASADICPHCGAATAFPPPHTAPAKRLIDRPWLIAIVMLHVGLLGIPLYWKTRYSRGVRLLLVLLSIAYTVFAVLVIVWAAFQIARAVQVLSS